MEDSSSNMRGCPFLDKLPVELRLTIYEQILRFEHPIKLRQVVPGSKNTSILRTCKHVYREALPVLFEVNTVVLTRNDFCLKTDASLKRPIQGQHIRYLMIPSFGESIACTLSASSNSRCHACDDSATGFLGALAMMPNLKTVTVDYSTQMSTFWRFQEYVEKNSADLWLECTSIAVYRVQGGGLENVDFIFRHLPVSKAWPYLETLAYTMPSEHNEEVVLGRLPQKLYDHFCDRNYERLLDLACELLIESWVSEEKLEAMNESERSRTMDRMTIAVHGLMATMTSVECGRYMRMLRETLKIQE